MKNLYAAFDLFPSNKGAATHIAHTLRAIEKFKGSTTLACLGHQDMPRFQNEGNIHIRRCLAHHPNFLKRSEYFADFLALLLEKEGCPCLIHFRDIWSGVPLLAHPETKDARTIYEVNGFASIELPVHYPGLLANRILLDRIKAMEQRCLEMADTIITVSRTNAEYIESLSINSNKIRIIPNMAEIIEYDPQPNDEEDNNTEFILYAGTLTPWQGIPVLLESFRIVLANYNGRLKLVLACASKKYLSAIRKIIRKKDLLDKVEIKIGLSREQLKSSYASAVFSVAPLTRCDRNELQGCCPLKIIESMAAATPVIASDLAVCREIIDHGKNGWLVLPDSPRALAGMMLAVLQSPGEILEKGRAAREKVQSCFSREIFEERLKAVYSEFLCVGNR